VTRCALFLVASACTATPPPREAAPQPLPTVLPPPVPENVEGTYELDPTQSISSMRMTLVFEELGPMKRIRQTAYMKAPEISRGHWRKDGDAVIFIIDGEETTCTRRSDQLVCGLNLFRRVQR
jgi:hypothetical protein